MCTPACSGYDTAFKTLSRKTEIPSNDSYYQMLLGKQNMACVSNFLSEIKPKVVKV